jgi:hypothetical protein
VPWLQANKQGNANFEGWKMITVGCVLLTLSVSVDCLSDGCPVWFTWKIRLYVSAQFNWKSIWLQQLRMHSQNDTLEQKPGLMLSWSDGFTLKLQWFWLCTICQYHRAFDSSHGMKVTFLLWANEVSDTAEISHDLGYLVVCSSIVVTICFIYNS